VHGPALAHEDRVVLEISDGPQYRVTPNGYTDEREAR